MNKSKKQIYVVYQLDFLEITRKKVMMITTSVTKLKSFIIKKIKEDNEDYYYDSNKVYTINQQINNFKFDFKRHHRDVINENLHGLKYDYVYDSEEQ